MDFTFNNTLIKKYFEGDDSYIPTSEFIYLHEHPLITPNFMTELNTMLKEAGEAIKKHNMKGHVTDKLTNIAIRIGTNIPNMNADNAKVILSAMREAYALSKQIKNMV